MVSIAIEKADSLDTEKVREHLAAIKYEGPQGKAHFDGKNQLIIDEYIISVKDGNSKSSRALSLWNDRLAGSVAVGASRILS